MKILKRILDNKSGTTAIEYGLIAAILGLGLTVSLSGIADSLTSLFTTVSTAMNWFPVYTNFISDCIIENVKFTQLGNFYPKLSLNINIVQDIVSWEKLHKFSKE